MRGRQAVKIMGFKSVRHDEATLQRAFTAFRRRKNVRRGSAKKVVALIKRQLINQHPSKDDMFEQIARERFLNGDVHGA